MTGRKSSQDFELTETTADMTVRISSQDLEPPVPLDIIKESVVTKK